MDQVIERNTERLRLILVALVAMAGFGPELRGEPRRTLPRHLRNAVLRLLRPAEAAARRLIVVAAQGLPPPALRATSPAPQGRIGLRRAPPWLVLRSERLRGTTGGSALILPRLRGVRRTGETSGSPNRTAEGGGGGTSWLAGPGGGGGGSRLTGPRTGYGGGAGDPPAPRRLAFCLVDPPRRFRVRRAYVPPHAAPRIACPGITPLHRLPPPPSPDDAIDATRIGLRLQALAAALDDLPGQARRLARWRARRERACGGRPSPLRPGRAPGQILLRSRGRWPAGRERPSRHRPLHEVHELLADLHYFARQALRPPDTS